MPEETLQLDPERIYTAIKDGVREAVWQMIVYSTSTPCGNFYKAIETGTERAVRAIQKSKA